MYLIDLRREGSPVSPEGPIARHTVLYILRTVRHLNESGVTVGVRTVNGKYTGTRTKTRKDPSSVPRTSQLYYIHFLDREPVHELVTTGDYSDSKNLDVSPMLESETLLSGPTFGPRRSVLDPLIPVKHTGDIRSRRGRHFTLTISRTES